MTRRWGPIHIARILGGAQALVRLIAGEPDNCAACGQYTPHRPLLVQLLTGPDLCPCCERMLTKVRRPYCKCCGRPVDTSGIATACPGPMANISSLRAAVVHDEAADRMLHSIRNEGRVELAQAMGRLMAMAMGWRGDACVSNAVVPVPLCPDIERQRGYNENQLLACEVGKFAFMPVRTELISIAAHDGAAYGNRIRAGWKMRVNSQVRGHSLVLIDADLDANPAATECADALRRAGAREVSLLVFAARPCSG